MTEQTPLNRTVVGKVISNKMNSTIVVQIVSKVKHPLYGKYVRHSSKMYAHDSENTCAVGDIVQIQQCRPISKMKHWTLVQVLEAASKSENE